MLDNTVSPVVSKDRVVVAAAEVFVRFEQYLNRSLYRGPENTSAMRDTMTCLRTLPTVSGNFRGTRKSTLKFTKDVAVPGVDLTTTLVAPVIFTLSASVPVGASEADSLWISQRLLALLDQTDGVSFVTRLIDDQEV